MSTLEHFLKSLLHQNSSQPAATPTPGKSGPLPIPECCICSKELPPGKSLAETFGQAGWNNVSADSPGRGLDAALYTALICNQCESISCYPCAGFRPDTHPEGLNISVSCPKCGGTVIPLNSEIYQTLLAKQAKSKVMVSEPRLVKTAIRILIAHSGNSLETSAIQEIIQSVWDGQVDPNVKITSRPVVENPSSSDENFARVWLMWQQLLQHQYNEHPYWDDHETFAYSGTITRTNQRFYIEIYYKESREKAKH